MSLSESHRWNWETGSGLSEPPAEGPYAGYYGFGRGAHVSKWEDGNWHMYGLATGGLSAGLPVSMENASTQQLVEMYFLTAGETHDFRILYRIVGKPLEEIKTALNEFESGRQQELIESMQTS